MFLNEKLAKPRRLTERVGRGAFTVMPMHIQWGGWAVSVELPPTMRRKGSLQCSGF
jgi:hypothetical protein